MRVGDLAAHDTDHVRLAGGDHVVRVLRRADVAFRLHARVLDHGLERLGVGHAQLLGEQERGHEVVEVEIAARAAGHVVDQAAFVVVGDDLLQRFHR